MLAERPAHSIAAAEGATLPSTGPSARIGDVAAMLRLMEPLNGTMPNPLGRRRLLADLCRLVGVSLGTVKPWVRQPEPVAAGFSEIQLPPRLQQTLSHLLDGDSEKQVAGRLNLSKHTVHVYVKALYRRYGVSSRGELLAKHLRQRRRGDGFVKETA